MEVGHKNFWILLFFCKKTPLLSCNLTCWHCSALCAQSQRCHWSAPTEASHAWLADVFSSASTGRQQQRAMEPRSAQSLALARDRPLTSNMNCAACIQGWPWPSVAPAGTSAVCWQAWARPPTRFCRRIQVKEGMKLQKLLCRQLQFKVCTTIGPGHLWFRNSE